LSVRVDFYVVADSGADTDTDERARTACRLAERAWKAGHRVFVLSGNAQAARQLDELMWTFRQNSFVPHTLVEGPEASTGLDLDATPVWLGSNSVPDVANDVLINLTDDVPLTYARFNRVAEIIAGGDDTRAAGRTRFRFYREHDCDVHTHNL
jgi:DNA polymerase-3 subunit chi